MSLHGRKVNCVRAHRVAWAAIEHGPGQRAALPRACETKSCGDRRRSMMVTASMPVRVAVDAAPPMMAVAMAMTPIVPMMTVLKAGYDRTGHDSRGDARGDMATVMPVPGLGRLRSAGHDAGGQHQGRNGNEQFSHDLTTPCVRGRPCPSRPHFYHRWRPRRARPCHRPRSRY